MDVKAWMVNSITYKRILHFTRRLYFGKFCYIIKFEVRGKYIGILNIKRIRNQKSWEQRVNRRYKFLKQYRQSMLWCQHHNNSNKLSPINMYRKMLSCGSNQTGFLQDYDYQRHSTTQTTPVYKSASSTQTKIVRVYPAIRQQLCRTKTTVEQYPPAVMLARECQTEIQNINQSIQCQTKVYAFGVQTNLITYTCCSTQTFSDELVDPTFDYQPLRKIPQLIRRKNRSYSAGNEKAQHHAGGDEYTKFISTEKEAVVYMLSEIGELVLNQNHMLSNNSKMLTQISELAVVTKKAELAQSWKNSKKYLRWCRYRKCHRCCHHHLHYQKSNALRQRSCKTTQTDALLKFHKTTQTSIDALKNRRIRFFDKVKYKLICLLNSLKITPAR